MSVYNINYYLQEETHSCGCGCEGEEHTHEHEHAHRDDYDIVGTIKTFGAWANLMPDSYLVKSDLSAEEMKAQLMEFLQPSDILFIAKVDTEGSASSISQVIDWIQA